MKIISFVLNNSGPCYHRLISPLMLMKDADVYITNDIKPETFDRGCDLFIYNRVIPDILAPIIADARKKYGFKICVDVDDYWNLDRHHILFDEYNAVGFANVQIQNIIDADFVTTTNGRLVEEIMTYSKSVYCLPNAIPKHGQFNIERQKSELTRLFWQGSITHDVDVELLRRPIQLLQPIFQSLQMVMAGYHPDEPIWRKMALDYTSDTKAAYKLLQGKHVAEYYSNYQHADICLIPLVNSRFNRMKSNLKVLEAANLGLPVICSRVHPYLNMPVIYAGSSTEWVCKINRLVASKKRQREAGEELKEHCDIYFNFEKINKERKQIFEHECN